MGSDHIPIELKLEAPYEEETLETEVSFSDTDKSSPAKSSSYSEEEE